MPKIKYFTSIRKEILNKAVNEYLANHPEAISDLKEKNVVYGIGVKQEPRSSEEYNKLATHGPEWEGWREIPIGKHKEGDWVKGTICNWRGTISLDEERVPACNREIPPYIYGGGKYEQYCCNLHSIYTQVAYTIEEIKYRIRVFSGIKDWKSPLDVNYLSIMIEALEKNESLTEIGRKILDYRVDNSLVLFNNPIMRAKYPKVYTKELIERVKEYRKMPSRIAKMVRSDVAHRDISAEKSCYLYGIDMQEFEEALKEDKK